MLPYFAQEQGKKEESGFQRQEPITFGRGKDDEVSEAGWENNIAL